MSPLFALLVVTVGGGALVMCAFLFFRLSHPGGSALVRAVAFTGGAILGMTVAMLAATLVIGIGPTLETTGAVTNYAWWLGMGSLLGGLAGVKALPLVLRRFRHALADEHDDTSPLRDQ